MSDSSRSRDFNIDRQPSRDAVIGRLVGHYSLNRRKSHQAANHPDVFTRWILVEGTRGDFAVRCEAGEWQIRVRLGLIGPPG